ncbi:MAG: hypothetical protein KBE09_05650 [Candidatus Pacebacteria bacterium]|nr:hypothetical protein [Candidatus Paceibacterota bacterium]
MTPPTPNAALASAMRTLCSNLHKTTLEAAFLQCYRTHHHKRESDPLERWEEEMIAEDAIRCGPGRGGFPEYVLPYVERYIVTAP